MASSQRWKNRGIGAAAAVFVGLATLGSAGSAFAASESASGQIGGSDRYETAALLATTYWSSPSTVIVANGETGVDALTASYLAGVDDAPVLLTPAKATSKYTVDAIKALNPQKVVVIGGTNAVSADVYAELTKGRTGQRITGADRYETAANIVAAAGGTPTTAILAVGSSADGSLSADALAAGPIAYRAHVPILLTRTDDLPAATATALGGSATTAGAGSVSLKATAAYYRNLLVVGGKNAVSEGVRTKAATVSGTTVTRISGADRSATAALLAESAIARSAAFSTTTVSIVNGASVDGLTAGAAAGKRGAPMLLTNSATDLGTGAQQYLAKNAGKLTDITVVGGATAVPTSLVKVISASSGIQVPTTKPVVPVVTPTTPTTPTVPTPTVTENSDATAPVPGTGWWWSDENSLSDVQVAAGNPVQGSFDEALGSTSAVKVQQVTYSTVDKSEILVPVDGGTTVDGKVLTFTPVDRFTSGKRYEVTFTAVDLAGNKKEYTERFVATASVLGTPETELAAYGTTIGVSINLRGYSADQLEITRQRRSSDATVLAGDAGTFNSSVIEPHYQVEGQVLSFLDTDIAPGEYTYYAQVKDQAGTKSSTSKTLFVVPADAVAPVVDDPEPQVAGPAYSITGTAPEGYLVALYVDEPNKFEALQTVRADEFGRFSFDVALDEAYNFYTLRAFDADGAPSLPASVSVTVIDGE